MKEAEVVGGVIVRAPECWQASIMNPYVIFTMITGERKAETKNKTSEMHATKASDCEWSR